MATPLKPRTAQSLRPSTAAPAPVARDGMSVTSARTGTTTTAPAYVGGQATSAPQTFRTAPVPPAPQPQPQLMAAQAAPPPPAKRDIADVDWFNSDAIYKNQAGNELNNLMDSLSQLLYERQQGYQAIDTQTRDWGQNRDLETGAVAEDFASRGLLSSGLYRQGNDDVMRQYENQRTQIDQSGRDLASQYGERNSLGDQNGDGKVDRADIGNVADGNGDALAAIYGRFGQRGIQAGRGYQNTINSARAESAGRSTDNIIKTLGW